MKWQAYVVGGVLALVSASLFGRPAEGQVQPPRWRPYLANDEGVSYVCRATLFPPGYTPAGGVSGYVWVEFSELPDCGGAAGGVHSGGVFSQRATLDAADPTYEVSEAMLHTYFLMLQRAADTRQRVRWHRCSNIKQSCIRALGVDETPP